MNPAIVQINFAFNIPEQKLREHAAEVAEMFAKVEGLLWKIWIINGSEHITGGIYLFESREKAEAYADGDIVGKLRQDWPIVDVKVFDIMDEPSTITRAPLVA